MRKLADNTRHPFHTILFDESTFLQIDLITVSPGNVKRTVAGNVSVSAVWIFHPHSKGTFFLQQNHEIHRYFVGFDAGFILIGATWYLNFACLNNRYIRIFMLFRSGGFHFNYENTDTSLARISRKMIKSALRG